ncbi:hypothetical protein HO133_009646 [Letharia lupina]|uniref:Expansin-like EG45 domain-containing protein n=1 Tax=Letharia lupina TaxID=560253 RepID=A0A8H6CM42_9LECA|nr:uncharacterized protein HO133_009646 [Letharia lupina]KAF6225646.1 hypothetical protein HO133_009646 [Letharia lupina]
MHFAHFSPLLLLASTVAATPRHPWKGKWEHSHHHSSFASLKDASAGFAMPSGTGAAPVIPQGTVLVAAPKALVSHVPSGSSTESGGGDTEKEAANPQENPGLPSSSAPANAVSSTPAAATASKPAPTTPASPPSGGGVSYSATFTQYGLNDGNGSPNCNAASVSCGFYNTPGYNAAVSQNLFGAASGKTDTCGTCWQLDPVSNPNAANTAAAVGGLNTIVVMVNNLCPASSNEKDCGQATLQDTNFAGANVNFDLCKDDGAANALFGGSGIGMAFGKATQVGCDLWTGSQNYTTGTMPSKPLETS